MAVYMVTWATSIVKGENSTGNIFSSREEPKNSNEAKKMTDEWVEFIKKENPDTVGGKIMITGVFKL
jgi:hypothetical protein